MLNNKVVPAQDTISTTSTTMSKEDNHEITTGEEEMKSAPLSVSTTAPAVIQRSNTNLSPTSPLVESNLPPPTYEVALNCTPGPLATARKYPNNYIRTTKYTLYSFVPINLFNQFKRFYNIYFLLAAIFSLAFQSASPISPIWSVMPLVFVLLVTALKDGVEDYYRYQSDKRANNIKLQVIRNGVRQELKSRYLTAGDIVYVEKGALFPADLIFLTSSQPDCTCFIETSSLDGETNLKRKAAVQETSVMKEDDLFKLSARIECEEPNDKLNMFEGRFTLFSNDTEKIAPLGYSNILLRGSRLRNTDYIYGLCVYAGVDTKLFKNLRNNGLKFSRLEEKINQLLMAMFVFNAIILVISIVMEAQWVNNFYPSRVWYIIDDYEGAKLIAVQAMTYYTLYTFTIPISLFITLECVRVIQALFIHWDEDMRCLHPETKKEIPANAKNSNLNEELGRIEYIFSDKTGTLTQNIMRVSRWYVAGVVHNEQKRPGSLRSFIESARATPDQKEDLELFLHHVGLCHTGLPSDSKPDGEIEYETQSPDELALLLGVKANGVYVSSRDQKEIVLMADDRKRMSIIVSRNGEMKIFCKGADSIIMRLLKEDTPTEMIEEYQNQLQSFSNIGLRTLCFAWAPLSNDQYNEFLAAYGEASAALTNRDQKIDEAAKLIERDLNIIGCSAIEDKLQTGVPETIDYLLKCGIKIWVLTGDKRETAINIANSCKLFNSSMNIMIVQPTRREKLEKQLQRFLDETQETSASNNGLVIAGEYLTDIITDYSQLLIDLADRCHSVVCCRVTPLQKALVVRLVRKKLKKITLSIGDGANDVSMIQEAHVGVGICGLEGSQAVRASDYSFIQFQSLKRILTIHGRYSNYRLCQMVLYSLYKNLAFITVCFWFGIYSAWSGVPIYQETFLSLYNIVFASLPPLLLGAFEKDVSESIIQQHPFVYQQSVKSIYFAWPKYVEIFIFGMWHAAVTFFGLFFVQGDGLVSVDGLVSGFWGQSWTAGLVIMLIILAKFSFDIRTWTWPLFASVVISLLLYIILSWVAEYFNLPTDTRATADIHSLPSFYFTVIILPVIALFPDYTWNYVKSQFKPTDDVILREEERVTGVVVPHRRVLTQDLLRSNTSII